MKKVLSLIFLGMLLFLVKEKLRASSYGKLAFSEVSDHYEVYHSTKPSIWFGGIDSTVCEFVVLFGHDVILRHKLPIGDTFKIEVGGYIIVHCRTLFYKAGKSWTMDTPPVFISGTNLDVDGAKLWVDPATPPDDTLDPVTPSPQNQYSLLGGVVSIEGQKGVLVVLNYSNMLPAAAMPFQGELVYDLNQLGNGIYFCYIVFDLPYGYAEWVTQI